MNKLTNYFCVWLIGVACGYAWRMIQMMGG